MINKTLKIEDKIHILISSLIGIFAILFIIFRHSHIADWVFFFFIFFAPIGFVIDHVIKEKMGNVLIPFAYGVYISIYYFFFFYYEVRLFIDYAAFILFSILLIINTIEYLLFKVVKEYKFKKILFFLFIFFLILSMILYFINLFTEIQFFVIYYIITLPISVYFINLKSIQEDNKQEREQQIEELKNLYDTNASFFIHKIKNKFLPLQVLIIDDEKNIPIQIKKLYEKERPQINVFTASNEDEIIQKVENLYYNIAIVDLKMEGFQFDGIDIIEKILEINPFAKIIVISGYVLEYKEIINIFRKNGKIIDILDKGDWLSLRTRILENTDKVIEEFENNPSSMEHVLMNMFSSATNETDNYLKGTKFEDFTVLLFNQMGFVDISKRNKDKSLNEVDLIIRNEIKDLFFEKFSPYILVECKNTAKKVDKNDFNLFYSKLENTNGLANLGIIVTSNTITRNTYIEAARTSKGQAKIIFIDKKTIRNIIKAENKLSVLKQIIDQQVKDN